MAKNKTVTTTVNPYEFIASIGNPSKEKDSLKLITMMERISGSPAKMWGPTIIGFGNYHYKYDSGHEGDAPVLGFSPRKAAFSLYVFTGLEEHAHLLEDLGKFTKGKACIYVKKLEDINEENLEILMKTTLAYLQNRYTVS